MSNCIRALICSHYCREICAGVTASAQDRATVTTLKILVGAMATVAGKHASPSTEALQQSTKELGRKTEGELINVIATGLETLLQITK